MRIKNWERDPEGKDYQWWNKIKILIGMSYLVIKILKK